MQNLASNTEITDIKDQFQLVKLSPEQVSEQWEDGLKDAIEASLPPIATYETPERMNNILNHIIGGYMDCWTLWQEEEIFAVGVFQVIIDTPSQVKSLLIYALYTYKPFTYDFWYILLKALRQSAKQQGCRRIVGYTNVDRIIGIVNALGGSSDYRYIWLEV